MSAKKQSKPSKKPTTKGSDLPESVQWLLDFVNIGCKPGKISIKRVFGYTIVNRPPAEPATSKEVLFDGRTAAHMLSLDKVKRKEYIENKNAVDLARYCELFEIINDPNSPFDFEFRNQDDLIQVVDENGNEWANTPEGETIFRGNLGDYPSREEFRDFLLKTGISEKGRNMKQGKIEDIWTIAEYSLIGKMKISKMSPYEEFFIFWNQECAQIFVYDHYNQKQIQLPDIRVDMNTRLIDGLKYSHDNTLSQATCAYILDFWHNHRELHQHLKQCKCCGKFWIEADTRRKYCCKMCENRFNQASRQAVKESLREQRKKLGKDKKEITHNEIINWLCNDLDFKSKDAEKEYEGEKRRNYNNVKSLSNFKRTYGKRNGLI